MNKGIVLEVTDPELLDLTGGIVQGMSGSPIIQNGKLVGAVTHVFVQDATKGYGIFIENMLKKYRIEREMSKYYDDIRLHAKMTEDIIGFVIENRD